MCKTKKGFSQEVADGIEESFRPMRYEVQREIAYRFSRDVLNRWSRMEKDLFGIMREIAESRGEQPPSYRTTLREARAKRFYQEDIDALSAILNVLEPGQVEALAGLFTTYGGTLREVFDQYLTESYQSGLDLAYSWMKDGHPSDARNRPSRQDPDTFSQVPETYILDRNSNFFRAFYDDGLDLVTAKVSVFFKGEAFRIIADGIENSTGWKQIAREIHQSVGMGARWHWQRLVRTEMAIAYGKATEERYTNAGISYVSLSVAIGACPVCISAKGTYQLGQQPTIPFHPNCRCSWIPFYRLPEGIEARGPWSDQEAQ